MTLMMTRCVPLGKSPYSPNRSGSLLWCKCQVGYSLGTPESSQRTMLPIATHCGRLDTALGRQTVLRGSRRLKDTLATFGRSLTPISLCTGPLEISSPPASVVLMTMHRGVARVLSRKWRHGGDVGSDLCVGWTVSIPPGVLRAGGRLPPGMQNTWRPPTDR